MLLVILEMEVLKNNNDDVREREKFLNSDINTTQCTTQYLFKVFKVSKITLEQRSLTIIIFLTLNRYLLAGYRCQQINISLF